MKTRRRHLPHQIPYGAVLFTTWRLAGSLPKAEAELLIANPEREPITGPLWLKDPRIAKMIVDALNYGETERAMYRLYAYVIMPNHVHAIVEPLVSISRVMHWIKGATARRANRMLGLTGTFWQNEYYDHWIRSTREFHARIAYVEANPVKGRAGQIC